MKMGPKDYTIIRVEGKDMFVVGHMLSFGMEWPPTIHNELTGATFRFVTNEVMEPWMVGNVHGHARYEDISYAQD